MQVMGVVMMVMINRQALCVFAEQFDESRVIADLFRVARTADMAIEADHLVGGAHDQMQIVGHHQHATAMAVAQAGNQAVQLGLASDIDALYRLVKHQQLRFAQQGAGQQYALHFATGHTLHGAVDDLFGADFFQRGKGLRPVHARHQTQKA